MLWGVLATAFETLEIQYNSISKHAVFASVIRLAGKTKNGQMWKLAFLMLTNLFNKMGYFIATIRAVQCSLEMLKCFSVGTYDFNPKYFSKCHTKLLIVFDSFMLPTFIPYSKKYVGYLKPFFFRN